MFKMSIKNEKLKSIAEWAVSIALAVAVYFLLSRFVYATANVSGPSMNPTLNHGDKVFINKLSYVLGNPQKGDVIAFLYPQDPDDKLVKRIIGVPGDFIEVYDNKIYINGNLLDDDFSYEGLVSLGDTEFPLTVGEGEYFVLGDNRNNSKDSRSSSVGLVSKDIILGKVSFRFMPFEALGLVN